MIAGHFGFAAAVKAKAPAVPLWALMLACQWLDVVFVPLFASGVERLVPIEGVKEPGYGEVIIHADYTHSLVGAFVLAAIFGAVAALRYGKTSGLVLGSVVMSHWVLDLFMHRADMPLLPGDAGDLPRLGLGLWRSPTGSGALELLFVLAGAYFYWQSARRVAAPVADQMKRANLCGALVLASGVVVLVLNLLGV
ncbi:MAG: permease [Polyangiaceae bacterium]